MYSSLEYFHHSEKPCVFHETYDIYMACFEMLLFQDTYYLYSISYINIQLEYVPCRSGIMKKNREFEHEDGGSCY